MTQEQIDQIFNRQLQLAIRFSQIEDENIGLPFTDIPNDLTDYKGQFIIRFMLTCVQDEMWEAQQVQALNDADHLEELSDVLHYIVELNLRVGNWPHSINEPEDTPGDFSVIGQIFHDLKAKPWKVSPKPTNVPELKAHVEQLFWLFLAHVRDFGISDTQLYEAYFAKAKVNQQRIDLGA